MAQKESAGVGRPALKTNGTNERTASITVSQTATNCNDAATVQDAARSYLARGWQPVPVRNGKNPGWTGWEKFTCTPPTVNQHFSELVNVGLLNGAPSHGLVDVDLDTDKAVAIAGAFLPPTAMIGGHDKRPGSHGFYQLIDADGNPTPDGETKQFSYTIEKITTMVVELRGTGSQTIAPPSKHPDGGHYRWEQSGEPGRVTYSALLLAVRKIAIAATLAEHWPNPGRHNTGLSVAGLLYSCGVAEYDARALVEAAARADSHKSVTDRVRTVTDTYQKSTNGKPVKGIPSLKDCFPSAVVNKLIEWCRAIATRPIRNQAGTRTEDAPRTTETEPSDAWPEPLALPDALLPVLPFDKKLLPAPLYPWLSDIAERMQCPLDFPAVGALIGIASIVGRRVGIYPKRQDDWLVIPNLWGAAIGRPGILKTPALAEVLKPLKRLEMAARKTYEEETRTWQAKLLIRKLSREETEKKMRAAIKAGENVQAMAEQLVKEEDDPGPVLRRYMVNDATVEKLGVILNENPEGALVFRDELTGWLYTLEKEGHENDRTFYLEAWNGDGSYTYDRIGRGTIFIPAVCVSLLGGIQPSRLAEYLRATMHGGADDDGLMQRFQLAVYPDSHGAWRNVDTWPDTAAKQQANRLFDSLDALSPSLLGISLQEGERVPAVRFNYEAQEFFNEWRGSLETKLRGGELHPALESHLSKYRSLMPSLALLFFLLDFADGKVKENTVPLKAAELAAAWCDFLENHAHRIYSGVTEHALFSARLLSERIRQGALPNPFTLGAVLRKKWSGLGTLEDVRAAADLLEESSWIRAEKGLPGEKGGRPRFHYWVNPRVLPQKEDTK